MLRDAQGRFVRKDPLNTYPSKKEPTPMSTAFKASSEDYQPQGKPKGTLTLSVFGRDITLTGGPYLARPAHMHGVKMAREIRAICTHDIPTPDFSVPPRLLTETTIHQVFFGALTGQKQFYVGCMAGQGRTGLFLASAAYLAGIDDPVGYVRQHYYRHAVETDEQAMFVTGFNRDAFMNRLMDDLLDARWFKPYMLDGQVLGHREDLLVRLTERREIDWSWLRVMTWGERLRWLRSKLGL